MWHLVIFTFLGACLFTSSANILEDKIFFFQNPQEENNKTVLKVTWSHENGEEKAVGCEIFTNPRQIEEVIKASNDELIRKPSEKEMKDIVEECSEISKRRRREATIRKRSIPWRRNRKNSSGRGKGISPERDQKLNKNFGNKLVEEESTAEVSSPEGYSGPSVIFPGTKWCGPGDIAKNYDDLGVHKNTDKCCRAHDKCDDTLAPGETRHNLTNKTPFTKLSCQCDNDFYHCLDKVDSITSNTMGNTYFNLLNSDCYHFDYPKTDKCKKYKTSLKLICVEYERDTKAEKTLQWVPAKKYDKIPFLSGTKQ